MPFLNHRKAGAEQGNIETVQQDGFSVGICTTSTCFFVCSKCVFFSSLLSGIIHLQASQSINFTANFYNFMLQQRYISQNG